MWPNYFILLYFLFYIRVGGEENFFHCSRCDMCLGIQLKNSHKVTNNTGNSRCLLKWICAIKLSWTEITSSQVTLTSVFVWFYCNIQSLMSCKTPAWQFSCLIGMRLHVVHKKKWNRSQLSKDETAAFFTIISQYYFSYPIYGWCDILTILPTQYT